MKNIIIDDIKAKRQNEKKKICLKIIFLILIFNFFKPKFRNSARSLDYS